MFQFYYAFISLLSILLLPQSRLYRCFLVLFINSRNYSYSRSVYEQRAFSCFRIRASPSACEKCLDPLAASFSRSSNWRNYLSAENIPGNSPVPVILAEEKFSLGCVRNARGNVESNDTRTRVHPSLSPPPTLSHTLFRPVVRQAYRIILMNFLSLPRVGGRTGGTARRASELPTNYINRYASVPAVVNQ